MLKSDTCDAMSRVLGVMGLFYNRDPEIRAYIYVQPRKGIYDCVSGAQVELLSWKSEKDISGDGGVQKTIITKGDGWEKAKDADEVTGKTLRIIPMQEMSGSMEIGDTISPKSSFGASPPLINKRSYSAV